MKSVRLMVTVACFLGDAAADTCRASPLLTLGSSPVELSHVTSNSTIEFSLLLSGLDTENQLDSLAATVVFDPSLLGGPVISKGEIIPDPLDDPLDFLSLAEPGVIDVVFSTLSADHEHHITHNGLFYSFAVQALGRGTGSISIDLAGGTLFNPVDPASPLLFDISVGSAIPFTIVPEPGSAALAVHGLLLISILSWFFASNPSLVLASQVTGHSHAGKPEATGNSQQNDGQQTSAETSGARPRVLLRFRLG